MECMSIVKAMLFHATDLFQYICLPVNTSTFSSERGKEVCHWPSLYIKIRGKSNIRFENADRDR